MNKPLIVIIFDSISNSVFESQLLLPLIKQNSQTSIIIISFEKIVPETTLLKLREQYPHLRIIIKKRWPFMGGYSMYYAVYQLKKYLQNYETYTLHARGPLAGYVALKAANNYCDKVTIQARGLLAEEYAFAHKENFTLLHRFRYKLYKNLERSVYDRSLTSPIPVTIQAVSSALKDFLIQEYKTPQSLITDAEHDVPAVIPTETVAQWRTAIRTSLNIAETTYVYCYNGSIKPWQCPDLIIQFFEEQTKINTNIFLLIVSQDADLFMQRLARSNISAQHYAVLAVNHTDINQYLAAADVGLLFREPHIINWVSRPTKILEYKSVGLKIIHNNTVAWLTEPKA